MMERLRGTSSPHCRELFGVSGWHLERSILDSHVIASCRQFLDGRRLALERAFEEWVQEPGSSYARHQELLPTYEERGIPKDLRHFLTGEFDLETRLDPRLMEVLCTDPCRPFLANFLRTKSFFIHYPPMIRFKVAGALSSLVPVHQDIAYNRHLSDFATSWVPLVDINEDCGGIIAYEGSHLDDVFNHKASGAWSSRAVADLTRYTARHIHMRRGDLLLFPPTLLHESAPHRSISLTRYSIDFRIFRKESDTTKSYFDPFDRVIRRLDGRV